MNLASSGETLVMRAEFTNLQIIDPRHSAGSRPEAENHGVLSPSGVLTLDS